MVMKLKYGVVWYVVPLSLIISTGLANLSYFHLLSTTLPLLARFRLVHRPQQQFTVVALTLFEVNTVLEGYHALPKYPREELERIQKRAMPIRFPDSNYKELINKANIDILKERFNHLCNNLFDNIMNNAGNRLHYLPNIHCNLFSSYA